VPDRNGGNTNRPSPEALLEAVAREERSKLRLFVGAAAGVGKTYAMLQAARERRKDGVDLVVGVVETHGRADTEGLVEGLEIVPRRSVPYGGTILPEMDLDAILARHPAVVLVDELAHTNAPGSRHPKRYLDVEELLEAGIEVWSTLNIQHLESLNDVVAQITGVRVRETVPDRILDRADEVRLIDLSPEDLLDRLRAGKVYVPEQAERALQHFFQPAHLTALRELALRETAEHVEEQIQAQRRTQVSAGAVPLGERLVVAVDGGPLSECLVRAARRVSERRGTAWIAVFVEPPDFHRRSEAEQERIASVLRLAEQLGGEAVTLPGPRIAEALLHFARERNASEIVMGKPRGGSWRLRLRRSPVEEVVRRSGPIDVRIVEGIERAAVIESPPAPWIVPSLRDALLAVGSVAAAGLAAAGLGAVLPIPDPLMIFLVAVLVTAVGAGLWPSIGASILAVLVYDFFFTEPYYSFSMDNAHDVLATGGFLGVAILTSHLTARARDQAEMARRREARTASLYAFARVISGAASADELLRGIVDHVGSGFRAEVVLLLPEGDELRVRAAHPRDAQLAPAERATARWAFEYGRLAGYGTDTLPGSQWLHVRMATARGPVGVLALHGSQPEALLRIEQRDLLEALADQAAVAIERTRIDAVLAEKAKTEAIIEGIDDGLVVLDPDGVVVHVNEVACAILDVRRQDALGRSFERLGTSHPHYLRLRAAVRDFLARPEQIPETLEIAMFLRGRDHFFVLRPTPLRTPDGGSLGVILALQDITYLRDQEARREQLMATLSHELRTPLTSLQMAGDLLARANPPLPSDAESLVRTIREDVARLDDLAQRLLDLSRSRAMSIALERETISLGNLVERMSRLFAVQAREHAIALQADVPAEDLRISADATKLSWALSNLIGNALRYTPQGGTIRIEAIPAGEMVRISVSDSGPGVAPEKRERIFERFAQGDDSSGAGLGLAIVRDVVQAHGGRIFLDSEPGHGSRFTIELPRGPTG
jgi:two-component system sensor histidine kinase KdpD